tara:strand:+ start:605 stop:1216 length:612 start_codon:yes stop_codon:yes gene_type:complete
MKNIFKNFIILFLIYLVSCNGPEEKKINSDNKAITQNEISFEVDTTNSSIEWVGTMVGIYKHNGLIAINDGNLFWTGNSFNKGKFSINMNSITQLDTLYKTAENKLVRHLESADFFDVINYPTASFTITESNSEKNSITGNLTIRGITNSETVSEIVFDKEQETVSGIISFDRQKYGVFFKGSSKDMLISDVIDLKINLKLIK